MSSDLNRLVSTGVLSTEAVDKKEFEGLVQSGLTKLKDAATTSLSVDSRFDLAYNAAHALCLAALRYRGYRPSKRYIVFQSLPHTLGLGPDVWRVLAKCHDARNRIEYEGVFDADETLLKSLFEAAGKVAAALKTLPTLK